MSANLESLDEFYKAVENRQVDNDELEDRFWHIATAHRGNPEIMKGVISSIKKRRGERAGLMMIKLQKILENFETD